MSEMLRKRLEASKEAFGDERVRWLIGKSRELAASSVITEKELDSIIEKVIEEEVERHMILNELKNSGPLTLKKLSEGTEIPEKRVQNHIRVLRFLKQVSVLDDKEEPLFSTSEDLGSAEDKRVCPCEAFIMKLLKEKVS